MISPTASSRESCPASQRYYTMDTENLQRKYKWVTFTHHDQSYYKRSLDHLTHQFPQALGHLWSRLYTTWDCHSKGWHLTDDRYRTMTKPPILCRELEDLRRLLLCWNWSTPAALPRAEAERWSVICISAGHRYCFLAEDCTWNALYALNGSGVAVGPSDLCPITLEHRIE